MTPWDVITAPSLPANIVLLPLSQAPGDAVGWDDIRDSVITVPSVVLEWTATAAVTPGLRLAARPASIRIMPPDGGETVTVQALALVELTGNTVVLAVLTLTTPAPLSVNTGVLVLSTLVVVQAQQ